MCLPYEICAGLFYPPRCCSFGRVSAFIPAIYLHSGRVAGSPVALTIDGSGLTMTKKGPFFYYPNFGPPSISLVPGVLLRGRSASRTLFLWGNIPGHHSGSIGKNGPFFITCTLGTFHPKLGFLGGLGVVGPFPSFSPVPHPLSLHPSPVKSVSNKKRDLLGPFLVVLVLFV